ncbi:MAG: AmmeMemoRadiSam system protein B [Thermodesulfobacteriota bacterium]
MDFPKLRPLHIFPIQLSGEVLVCLQDPLNLSGKTFFLPPPLYFIVSLFDGAHSILDIQAEYMRRFGSLIYREKIEELIQQLDENFLLEGERFEEILREKEEEFKKAPIREAIFSGKSYEKDPPKLKAQLSQYFTGSEGPGPLGEERGRDGLKGVIAPHIDFQRGGFCYAFAHREIWERNDSNCFIIFGISHQPMKHIFSATRKDFETPLGLVKVDQNLLEEIQSRYPFDLFVDEGAHRGEHSIEFQCVFLRYLYPEPMELRIVPVLCGSFQEMIQKQIYPMDLPAIRIFIEAVKESVTHLREKVCYLASADLAHQGLQFGDREGIREYDLQILKTEDQEMLEYVAKGDGEGFYSLILRENDQRRICGLPAIYVLLKILEPKDGRLLKYGQAYTPEIQSVVSFASLAFYS